MMSKHQTCVVKPQMTDELPFLTECAFQTVSGVMGYGSSQTDDHTLHAETAFVWFFVDTNLVGVYQIMLPVLPGRGVRHQNIGSALQGLLPALGVNGARCSRSRHVCVLRDDSCQRRHLQNHLHGSVRTAL